MKLLKKCLVLVVMFGLVISSSLQVNADEIKYIRGTFKFGAHDNDHDLTDSYIYTDDFFKDSADNNDIHLAIMSMIMASASISSKDEDYANKSTNIQDLLKQIGFEDISVNQDYTEKMGLNTMGVAVGHKSLDDNTVLLAIVPRSAGYESEWGGNFNIGKEGLHEGFKTGRDVILTFTKDYVAQHSSAFEGKTVKVWTMGYSRGAGVANLIGAALVDNSNETVGLSISRENIYDYTFGTPLTAAKELTAEGNYNNIHNYYADYDMVAMLPMEEWGFNRYGTTTYLDVHNADTKAKMLSYLQVTNPTVYANYTSYDDPDNYQAKTLGYNSETSSFYITNDDTRSVTLKDFVSERLAYLAKHVVSRGNYSSYYETAMTHATALLVGGDDEVVAKFMAGASKSQYLKQLAVVLFFYNWIDEYAAGKEGDLPENWLTDTINKLKPLEESDTPTGKEIVDEILKSQFYKELYQKYIVEKLSKDGTAVNITTYKELLDYYKNLSGYYMKEVLSDGLRAIGYSEEDIAKHTMIVDDNPTYLSVVAAYALFGTEDSASTVVDGISAAINKAKTALTLVGNSCYLRVHNNEVILSWLRAMDTNPLPAEDTKEPEKESENKKQDITNIPCEEAYGTNWTWSEKKGQCVYRVTNTKTK